MAQLVYPPTRADGPTEVLHGFSIADPYRWLEDLDSPATRAWTQEQNQLTFSYLESIPERDRIRERLRQLWNFPRATGIVHRAGLYFQLRNTGLQDQDVLYVSTTPGGEGRVLLDPNTLSEEGTAALVALSVSPDARLVAYAISQAGSDWQTWRVREVASGQDLPDRLEWAKFSSAGWLPDGSGFYYCRFAQPGDANAQTAENRNHLLYLHRLGRAQAEDELVFARPDQPDWLIGPTVSDDGRFLVLQVFRGTDPHTLVLVKDLAQGGPLLLVVTEFRASYDFIGSRQSRLYFLSDDSAPKGRIVALDFAAGAVPKWTEIVPESQQAIDRAALTASGLLIVRMADASHRLALLRDGAAAEEEIALPALGSIVELSANAADQEAFMVFASFLHPPAAWRVDLISPGVVLVPAGLHHPPPGFDPSAFQTRQVVVTSRDGTPIPLFLTHRRSLVQDGENPTLLYGYGGFNVSMTPAFQAHRLHWLERGGVLAWAILRGGGEYGREWHDAGRLASKQNVFDDFIACAEWLIAEGYTRPRRLAIQGGSNGGLLIGACMTQRPELFGVALPSVGVMDMLRFHKFTIGWAWVSDYGSPEDPAQFRTLLAYSPLHNLKPGTAYPATLITTADHDDRVVPAHSFKFAAALQAAHAGETPVLIRIQVKAGHGLGKPVRFIIEEQADIYSFTLRAMGLL